MPTLDWLNKNETLNIAKNEPYRLLEHDQSLSYGDGTTGNMIIQGDNLNALKALLPYYAGQVKCICIDPPYNTKNAFEHYDDSQEHSLWLSMMYPRLELLKEFLSEDGSIWVSIDHNECHYLKVVMDEIFGRRYFIQEIIWEKRTSRENRASIGSSHDTILIYTKIPAQEWKKHRNLLPPSMKGFTNPDNDPRGPWDSVPFSAQGYRKNQMYEIISPTGKKLLPPRGRCWGATEGVYKKLLEEDRIYFPKKGNGRPRIKEFKEDKKGLVPQTIWKAVDCGDNEQSKKEILALFDDDQPFRTPKPEKLIENILRIATNEDDLVLDSFLGSGTTVAVAHKMKRKYIGVELGEHAKTLCVTRLKKVIDGEKGGVSLSVNWQGGGGYRFYRLGSTIFDDTGTINKDIKFPTLASHIWFSETKTPLLNSTNTPLLGVHEDTAYYLLFNGILGDKRPDGGNVLTTKVLKSLPDHDGTKVIYGERTMFGSARLKKENIIFKQIPYDIKAR